MWVLIGVALFAVALAAATGWLLGQRRDGLGRAAEAILPAVVTVHPAGARGVGTRTAPLSSGFVVDETGGVVASDSALGETDAFAVELADGERVPARRVGRDPASDLALLRLETAGRLRAAQWGDSRTLRPGDWVLTAGAGADGAPVLGLGVVTRTDRRPAPNGLKYVRSDAPADPAAAGAPLVDRRGRVVGVVASGVDGVPPGHALASEVARPVVVRLLEDANAEVRR
jgi:serine protease Do